MADQKAKVFILYTGGTIGMAPEDPSKPGSPLVPQPLKHVLKLIPGLKSLEASGRLVLKQESFEKPVDSSNIGPDHWVDMAKRIHKVYDDFDGFVILHGTDTMSYTSSALAFMFENLAKPVVITGSQLPISDVRTDAIMNFVNAVQVAGYKAFRLPCIPEVVIVFADKIIRGCRARKVSATSWGGFDSPNFPPLGHIGDYIRIDTSLVRGLPAAGQTFQVNSELDQNVIDIVLAPGFTDSHLRMLTQNHGAASKERDAASKEKDAAGKEKPTDEPSAVILRTYGAGNAPTTDEFLAAIEELSRAGKTIVNVTQCLQGMVEMGLYAASSGLLERGVISALDMTPEAALTKLMWTLGTKLGDQVGVQMQVNQRGEQSENLFDLRYGACGGPTEPQQKFARYITPDRRLDVTRLTRAVVRLSNLEFDGVEPGDQISLRIFMNMPSATVETPSDNPRCVAEINIIWRAGAFNEAEVLDENKVKSVIGEGDITLTVVCATPKARFWFKGLYLALFARA